MANVLKEQEGALRTIQREKDKIIRPLKQKTGGKNDGKRKYPEAIDPSPASKCWRELEPS